MSKRISGKYLYIVGENQFYTFNANGKLGKTYRCRNRNCKSRVILTAENKCFKSNDASDHNHSDTCEEEMDKLVALEKIKSELSDVGAVASGSKMAKPRDVYKKAIIE